MLRRPCSSSDNTTRLFTRRNVLLMLGAGFTLFNLPRWLTGTTPQRVAKSASEINPPIRSTQQNELLALSALLTGYQHLSPQTSARTYVALSDQSPQFQQQVSALFQLAKTQQVSDIDTLFSTLKTSKQDLRKTVPARRDDADSTVVRQGGATPPGQFCVSPDKEQAQFIPLIQQIISAWYLGTVGEGPDSQAIVFESALMFDQVHDVLAVPGYCPTAPGYWVTQPFT